MIDDATVGIRQGSAYRALVWGIIAAVSTVGAYLMFLPWDAQKELAPDGYLHGPYEANQVIGLVVALLLIALVTGWFSNWTAPWVVPPVLTLIWSIDAMNDVENDGLWLVGAAMILVAATAATFVLVLLGKHFKKRPTAPI